MTVADGVIMASEILTRLRERYSPPTWLAFPEMRISTGYKRGEQRIDLWAMHTYPSEAYKRVAFEIKTSRADFSTELRKPAKRRPALLLANLYYFAAPKGVVPVDKLPIDSGLLELHYGPTGGLFCRETVKAPWLDTEPPTWGFVAALIRRMEKMAREEERPE